MYGLGRRHAVDSRDYRLSRIPMALLPERNYFLPVPLPLDQGETPHCVEYATRHKLLSVPVKQNLTGLQDGRLYHEAQLIDEWPGEDYDGTSVRAGMKIAQQWGMVSSYWFCYNTLEIRQVLYRGVGPIILGTNWYEDMFDPDAEGYANIGGQVAGGHAYILFGYSLARRAYRCLNSWGQEWGQRGRFWLSEETLRILLSEQGDAVAAFETRGTVPAL